MIMNFLLGLLIGFVGLWFPNLRIITMLEGKITQSFFLQIVSSITLTIFTTLAAHGVMSFIVGNTLGGAIAVAILAYKKKKGE